MTSLGVLLALTREGLQIEKADDDFVVGLCHRNDLDWPGIYKVASLQGVAAITFDALKRWMTIAAFKASFPKPVLFRWASSAMKVEELYAGQWKSALLLSNLYAAHNVRTVVLKGFAAAQFYPQPHHRACGDLDCFLFDDYEKGNELVRKKGITVDYDFYKHSEFDVRGLHVENHHFCTAVRGSRRAKDFERLLQRILKEQELPPIGGSHLLSPPPMFNALFLTKHALGHFLSEGITIRHLCDWAMFVQAHHSQLDWNQYVVLCRKYGLLRFADAMTGVCVLMFHIQSPFALRSSVQSRRLILRDSLSLQDKERVNEGTFWKQRLKLVTNIWKDRWKYKYYAEESYAQNLLRLVRGYLFDRNPEI